MRDAPHWDFGRGCCTKHLGQPAPCPVCIEAGDFVDDDVLDSNTMKEFERDPSKFDLPNLQRISPAREEQYREILAAEFKPSPNSFFYGLFDAEASRRFEEQSNAAHQFSNPALGESHESPQRDVVEQGGVARDQVHSNPAQQTPEDPRTQVAKSYGALNPYLWAGDRRSLDQLLGRTGAPVSGAEKSARTHSAWLAFLECFKRYRPGLIAELSNKEGKATSEMRTQVKSIMFGRNPCVEIPLGMMEMLPRAPDLVSAEEFRAEGQKLGFYGSIKNPCGEIALTEPELTVHARQQLEEAAMIDAKQELQREMRAKVMEMAAYRKTTVFDMPDTGKQCSKCKGPLEGCKCKTSAAEGSSDELPPYFQQWP